MYCYLWPSPGLCSLRLQHLKVTFHFQQQQKNICQTIKLLIQSSRSNSNCLHSIPFPLIWMNRLIFTTTSETEYDDTFYLPLKQTRMSSANLILRIWRLLPPNLRKMLRVNTSPWRCTFKIQSKKSFQKKTNLQFRFCFHLMLDALIRKSILARAI